MGIFAKALGLQTLGADMPVGDYSADVIPPPRSTAPAVTVDRALTLPAVFRAVQIIAGMGAQLTLDSWRGTDLVTPAPSLVAQPDPWRPLSSWLERVIVDLATDGNAFLLKHKQAGAVVALEVLDPHAVTVLRDRDTGVKSYAYTGINGQTRRYSADQVEHIWGLEVPGHDRGLSPISWCRAALSGALDVRQYADQWFRDNDVPSGVLSSDQRLDPEAAKAYKAKWLDPDDTGRVGPTVRVLGQGLTYSPIALKPADAQWLEAQSFAVLDIARMFGLPGDYLLAAVEGSSLTYANLEMIDAQFLRLTLFPVYLRKIEAALTSCLPRGQVARFNTAELLRPDAKTRAEIDKTYIDAGVIAPAEVRLREGWSGPAPARPAAQETPA